MSRPSRVRALALPALLAAAGCQDYNFNPVGHCLIQPGTERVTLSDISTADVLFVVDDSGSMGGEQAKLAANFSAFINNLNTTNVTRVAQGQTPIDFHVAITTTSVFYNAPTSTPALCRDDCPGSTPAGATVCCNTSGGTPIGPTMTVQRCTGPADATCAAGACRNDCNQFLGEYVCCDAGTKIPQRTQQVACATLGAACGDLQTHYRWDPSNPGCTPGVAVNDWIYPQGAFVGAGSNPKVIHFDKSLYTCATPPCTNDSGQTVAQLQGLFSQNVAVGTCGSNEEQALQAGRLAVEKAVAGTQPETWLHPAAKLVLVVVGDEDDCSSPQDASKGIILTGTPGNDSCVADEALPADQQRMFPVSSFVDYLVGLGRPLGAAFIVSARAGSSDVCQDESCAPDVCCDTACTGSASVCTTNICGGQAPGKRLLEAASELRAKNADVVAGSVCASPDFSSALTRVAEVVKQPIGLQLPTQPARAELTILRIVGTNGKTRKTCSAPAPVGTSGAALADYDWWFSDGNDLNSQIPRAASRFITINRAVRRCEANPGETYSADYLGLVPVGGCDTALDCELALGLRKTDWVCQKEAGALPGDRGTCLCGG
jgi:hypothetical protein